MDNSEDFYKGFDKQSFRFERIEPIRVARVLQLQGGSNSGKTRWQELSIKQIYSTPEGLVIEVL